MSSAIEQIKAKTTKVVPKNKYHFHVTGATVIELENGDKTTKQPISVPIDDDPYRKFYMVYLSSNEKCVVSGTSPETDACLFVIGSNGIKHEIIVQSGDRFTIIGSPGHMYCIRSEAEECGKVEQFKVKVEQKSSTIVNPLPGRQYNVVVALDIQDSEWSNTGSSFIHVNCFHI